jgi:hypothetical protein
MRSSLIALPTAVLLAATLLPAAAAPASATSRASAASRQLSTAPAQQTSLAAKMAAAGLVGENPVDFTPHVRDGEVRAIAVVGDTVIVGGDFTSVAESDGRRVFERWYIFAFSLQTGRVLGFDPWLDGPVHSLTPGPGNSVFVGGAFRSVDDADQRGLARIDVGTGARMRGFNADLRWGDVRGLAVAGGWLYVGGWFDGINKVGRKGLARLDLNTGAVDTRWDPQLAAPSIGRVKVEDIAISPRGDRLLAIGAMTQVGAAPRAQVAMFDLTGALPTLAPWTTNAYDHECRRGFDTWVRAVDFAPNGDYFVLVTTGRTSSPTNLCDTAARFETYRTGLTQPTWVNHTGGDSLYAVEITERAVYVGGHQRWMDNPHGKESQGPGAVARPGIGAIDPNTGRATAWNPTRSRGEGVRALQLTARGLLVGSDTDQLGREYHGRVGLFPPV